MDGLRDGRDGRDVRDVFRPLRAEDPVQVAGYRFAARLGAGGMGRVYLSHTPGGRPVAVKVVRPELADNPDFRRRFGREIQAARRVRGAYTAEVIDADPDGVPPWLATLYVPGPSLAEAVGRRGPLPVPAVLWLMAGVAEALQAIHDAGIVHRDLKPSNVLLASDGPRVIDFGISLTSGLTSHTATGVAVGTPEFMAPEQASVGEVTPATDVFALGQTAAFAALGEPLYGTGSSAGVLYRIVHSKPDLGVLPERIRPLIARCLETEPERRATLAEVVAWCREELGHEAEVDAGAGAEVDAGAGVGVGVGVGAGAGADGSEGAGGVGPAVWREVLGPEVEVPPPPAAIAPLPSVGQPPSYGPYFGYGAPAPVPYVPTPAWKQPDWVSRRWNWRRRTAVITASALGAAVLLSLLFLSVQRLVDSGNHPSARPSSTASGAAPHGTAASGGSDTGVDTDDASGTVAASASASASPTPPAPSVSPEALPYAYQFLDEKTSLSFTEPVGRKDRNGDIRFDCKTVGCQLTSHNTVMEQLYIKSTDSLADCRIALTGAKSHSLDLDGAAVGSKICARNASGDIALLVIQTKSTALWNVRGTSFLVLDMTVWKNLA